MDIQKLIETILDAAKTQQKKQDFQLVQQVLNLSQNECEETIIQLRGIGCKSVCSAPLPKNVLFYKCFDCSKEPTHVYCQDCYVPEKHLNHVVTYNYSNGGCCDCGDTLVMKKKSFCTKHSQAQIEKPDFLNILGENLTERFRQFIMVSFGLLFQRTQKILDYTDQLNSQIEKAIEQLQPENSINFMNENMPEIDEKETALKEGYLLYTLIFQILKFLTQDNITWSYATSKFLQIPIDIRIQEYIKLYHVHSNNQFANFKLDTQEQICQCSILNLFVKHNVFFSRFLKEDSNRISDLFYEFHVDENFKNYLCQQILKQFNHLYNPIQVFKLITIDNQEIKFKLNTTNYSPNSKLNEIIQKLIQDKSIKKIYCKNKIERASLFNYFFQFMGHLIICLLNLFKEYKDPQIYQLFDVFSNQLLQLPLCNFQTHQFCSQFDDLIVQQFYDEVVKKLFDQIFELLSLETEPFKFGSFNPKNPKFRLLQQHSLLIYTLTKIYPCQQNQTTTFHFLKPQEYNKFYFSIVIQISTLQGYRKLLSILVETWNDVYKQNKVGLQIFLD
ncbi:unnamed protein product [Paramecium sonneborni]|uniref:RING-type E3 ubiquitin transferase n=1 Tax=Paramecium sonneborni TaxID=65129 RepID=A0A8S1QUT8_9CILI|nr:unnamed protein product [Paramecium sonneborni]